MSHPPERAGWSTTATILGGPALFLLGNFLFKASVTDRTPISHLAGIAALAIFVPASQVLPALALAVAAAAVLVVVAALERRMVRSRTGARNKVQ